MMTYSTRTIFRVEFIVSIIPGCYATAATAFNEHSEERKTFQLWCALDLT